MQRSWFRSALLLTLVLLLSLGAFVACNSGGGDEASPAGEGAFPITVERSDGTSLTLERRPERIISLSAGGTEALFAVGAGEQVVAVDKFSDYPAETGRLPKLEYVNPDPETIVSYNPDLVLVSLNTRDLVSRLDALGLKVLYLDAPDSIQGVIDQVRLLGRVTGHPEEGERVAAEMERRVKAVTDRLNDVQQGPRVYHELDPSFFTVSPNSFVGDLYNLLKAQNIAAGAPGEYPQLSQEVILERDPEVIVLAITPAGTGQATAADVKARPGWDAVSAVRSNRVHEVNADLVSRPGPRVVEGLEALARLLYPERFR
ncbi:MAG TPA: ABC transporter substrate-binding protein [Dehalococcoidia bacterium]